MTVQLGSAYGKIILDATGVQAGMTQARGAFSGLGGMLGAAGLSVTAVGAALVGVGVAAATTAGEFETQMNVLSVAARDSGVALEDLRAVALRAGSDTTLVGVSASDVAEAMTGFARAGMSVNTMLGDMSGYMSGTTRMGGALRGAIDLAAASELDLAQAQELVVTTMSTFGLSADQVVGAMNNYVQTADASVASVSDLRDAMASIGPTAAAFGWSLADTNQALAILSTRGITGAEAGTALKSMLVNVMRDTKDVNAALQALNISLYDQAGNMRSLPDIIGQLSTSMAGLTTEQRNQYVQTLAGSYGMKTMNTLLSEGTAGWNDMTTAIANAATMQESAAARTRGFQAATAQLKDSFQTLLITIGTPLIQNVLTPALQGLADVVTSSVIPGITSLGARASAVFAALKGSLESSTQASGSWAEAWQQAQTLIERVAPAMRDVVTAVMGEIQKFMADHGAEIEQALRTAWESIGQIVTTTLEILNLTIVPLLQESARFIGEHGAEIQQVLGDAWTMISTYISTTLGIIQGVLNTVLAAIRGDWSGAWEELKRTLMVAWQGYNAIVAAALDAILVLFGTNLANVETAFVTKWNEIKAFFTELLDGFNTKVSAILDAIKTSFSDAVTAVGTALGALTGPIDTAKGIIGDLAGVFDGVGGAISGVISWLGRLAAKLGSIQLPGWLTPGSPTPFEVGLWGIVDALKAVSATNVPLFGARPGLAFAPAGGGSSYVINLTVNAAGDAQAVTAAAERGVLRAARELGVR